MDYEFDPLSAGHDDACICPCCVVDLEDMELGVQQALEMLDNMLKYGTIDKPEGV